MSQCKLPVAPVAATGFRTRRPLSLQRGLALLAICGPMLLAGCAPKPTPAAASTVSISESARSSDIVVLDIGGTAVGFAPIDGWCIYPPESQAQSLHMLNKTSPELVALSSFGDCGQIEAARALDGWVEDSGYIATPKEFLHKDFGDDRTAFVKAAAAELRRTNMEESLSSAQNQVAEVLRAGNIDVQFGKTTNLGVVDQDENAVYFAVVQNAEANSSTRTASLSRMTVGAITLLRGRSVMLYFSSDYEPGRSLELVLARCKMQVERLIGLNPAESAS
jgi:hypothetical protein